MTPEHVSRRLKPWRLSASLTPTRTMGEVGLIKNGTMLDIWVRVDGKARWFQVRRGDVEVFLEPDPTEPFGGHGDSVVLFAESDGNAEP